MKKLAARPVFQRILLANAAAIALVAAVAVLVTRQADGTPLVIVLLLVLLAGTALVTLLNYLLLKVVAGPLLEVSQIVDTIRKGGDPHQDAAGDLSDPDICAVPTALMEMVDRLEREARRYSSRLLTSVEDERRRIGRELHDETSQTLAATLISLDLAEKGLAGCPPEVRQRVAGSRELITHTLEQIKLLVYDLRPSMLDDLGLVPALRWYIQSHLAGTGLTVVADFERAGGRRLPGETETALYRIAQETLANVVKHAHASRVELELEIRPGYACLAVHDDGIGFDPDRAIGDEAEHHGLGLLSVKERVDLLDGTLNLVSSSGAGTHVYVVIPLEADDGE